MVKQSKRKNKPSDKNDFFDIVFTIKYKWWLILALVVITFVVFSPTLNNDFVRWDDNQYVTENELIKDISIDKLGKFGNNVGGNFHPLTMISLALDYHFFGLNPFYFHLKNLLFHLLNTVLVFLFILKISKKNVFVSFFTALLFGIHPMHVESVAWVSERKDVLFSFYFLAGLLLYYEFREKKKYVFYFLTIISFLLSALAKSAAVVFPMVLLLIDFYENGKINIKQIFQKIPFFTISIWIGITALQTQSNAGALEINTFTNFEKIKIALGGNLVYLQKFFFPSPLTNYYPIPNFEDNSLFYLFSILIVAILIFLIVKSYKKFPWVLWGFIFYILTIILVLQLIQVGGSFVSDRYTYIPYIGLGFVYFTFISILLNKLKTIKPIIIVFLVLQTGFWAVKTFAQTKVWTNTETLWSNLIESYPLNSSIGHYNLGEYYLLNGDTSKAHIQFNQAVEVGSTNFRAYSMRGKFYFETKLYNDAILDFTKALSINKNDTESLKGRSVSNFFAENYEKALIDIKTFIENDHTQPDAYNLLGNIYLRQNKLDLALECFNKAISLNSNYEDAIKNKSLVISLQEGSAARDHFNALIESNGEDFEALTNRGITSYNNGELEDALSDFNLALQKNSKYSEALRGRSAIYFDKKQYNLAIPDITEFLISNPSNYMMLNRRALCYINTNQPQKAIDDLSTLILRQPNNGLHYQGRGLIYFRMGNNEKALDDLLMANELGIEVNPNIMRALHSQ